MTRRWTVTMPEYCLIVSTCGVLCAGAMMATCRGAAAQLSQAGERGREQGARPRSRFPPFDKRRHATCTAVRDVAVLRELFPKCGVFCRLSLGELPRVPDRSTGGTGGARCTTVRASGPYRRYGYRRFAPYHVLVHSAHPYRVGPGSDAVQAMGAWLARCGRVPVQRVARSHATVSVDVIAVLRSVGDTVSRGACDDI